MSMLKFESSFRSFARLFAYAKKYRPDIYKGIFFSFLKKFFDIAPEILIGIATDVVIRQEKSFLAMWGIHSPLQQLIYLSILTLIVWACESLAEYKLIIQWRNLAQSIQHDVRID